MTIKPHIPVTLLCVDCTNKVHLAERAITKCLEQSTFADVKLLTHESNRRYAVQIPRLNGLEGYSNFMVRELHKYFTTSHALIVQWDGYALNAESWTPRFLDYDYIGPIWAQWKRVGNGGFSLRSKKLCEVASQLFPNESAHPEDNWLCWKHRTTLESLKCKFADALLAGHFGLEGRVYDGAEWSGTPKEWTTEFGFHSFLTVLPETMDRPLIFHHSGDIGDVIYSLATMKALGGGVMFLSGDNRYPYPRQTRWKLSGSKPDWVNNLAPLLDAQDYVWATKYTHALPFSTDVDFNKFRECYKSPGPDNFASLLDLHAKAFGVQLDETQPWLTVDSPVSIPDRPIIINRTERYHNDNFPWRWLTQKYGNQMAFVGTVQEYAIFRQTFQCFGVTHYKTSNLLELARAVAGAKCFIGNQSSPLSLALGLGQNVLSEVWAGNANCLVNRPNAAHWRGGPCSIEQWL